jgi:hypothetical protein
MLCYTACAPFPHLTYLATEYGAARSYKSLTCDRSLAVLQKYIEKTNQDQLAEEVMARSAKGRAG